MKILTPFILLFFGFQVFGNINFIELNEIPYADEYSNEFEFLKENLEYIDHWEMEWKYDINKDYLSNQLKNIHNKLSNINEINLELALLLGDVSFFLYNLDEESYFEHAEKYYLNAININPRDYRSYWFLANHYAKGNSQLKSIEYFLKAQEHLPSINPAEFWLDFSFATAVANMPSHSIFGMDQAKNILGRPSYFEEQLGENIRKRIIPTKSDSTYDLRDIWTVSGHNLKSYTSRALGMKILLDSTWNTKFFNYNKNMAFVTIVPPALTNDDGRDITYTIMFIAKVPTEGETLKGFIDKFVSRYPDIKNQGSLNNYSSSISLELQDPNMYSDIGGAHIRVLGIERDEPQYPGLLLERPMKVPSASDTELSFYRASVSLDRFKGRIFYAVMLDVCEDIYEDANAVFYKVFKEQTVIE
jgi:hypothetical protein